MNSAKLDVHYIISFGDILYWYIEMSKIPMNSNDEQKQVTRSVLSYTLDI